MRAVGIVIGIAVGACSSSATQATEPVEGASSHVAAASADDASRASMVGDGGAGPAESSFRDGGAAAVDDVAHDGGEAPAIDDAADKRRREEDAAAAALLAAPPPNPKSCPATFAKATGRCNASATCTYAEGECWCGPGAWCNGAAPPPRPNVWTCTPKVRPDGCPGAQPREGTSCATSGQRCDYTCACVNISTCTKGRWVTQDGPCKPSAPPRPR